MKSQLVALGAAIVMALAVSLPASAQPSTRNVSGPVTRFDVMVGTETAPGDKAFGLAVSAHTRLDETAGLIATAWLLGKNARYTTRNPPETANERTLLLDLAVELRFRLGADVLLSPQIGVGFSPWMHFSGDRRDPQGGPGLVPYRETLARAMATGGLTLRIRRLVISQRVIGSNGTSYAPFMIGWSF